LDPALTTGIASRARIGVNKILDYDSHTYPRSDLDPSSCGPGATPRDKSTWVVNTLKVMDQFPAVTIPDHDEHSETVDMDTSKKHAEAEQGQGTIAKTIPQNSWQAAPGRNNIAIAARSNIPQGRPSEGATSPERRAHNAPVDYTNIKHKYDINRCQPLPAEHIEDGRGSDIVSVSLVSDASSSRGNRMRESMTLTPEILAMLDRHDPDKTKQSKLLTRHLAGQRTLPSTEEKLHHHLERKARHEADRLMATAET